MMTHTATLYTDRIDSTEAGQHLGEQILDVLGNDAADVVVVFASSRFEYQVLLQALDKVCHPKLIVGSSSAGEFTGQARGEGTACALALRSDEILTSAGLGREVTTNRGQAAREVIGGFKGLDAHEFPYRTALIMTDALAGHTDELVEELTLLTAGKYQFAGGGAGDDAHFSKTHVFYGTEAFTDAVVGLELLSRKPIGIGVGHGWMPAGPALRVTEVQGARLIGLNGLPAVEAFEQHASSTGQRLDRQNPLPFFLHNILGIDTGAGHRLRVPLTIDADGAVHCAAEIPQGARVHIMKTTAESAVAAARRATEAAVKALGAEKPGAALFFDCVATRLRMGDVFGFELASVADTLHTSNLVGCNTYGQIARAEGQFGGFHNCTAVVLVLPS